MTEKIRTLDFGDGKGARVLVPDWNNIDNRPFDAHYDVIEWDGVIGDRFAIPLDDFGMVGAYMVHVSDKTFSTKELHFIKRKSYMPTYNITKEDVFYSDDIIDVSDMGMGTGVSETNMSFVCVYESDMFPTGTYFLTGSEEGEEGFEFYTSSLMFVEGERLSGYLIEPTGLGFMFDLTAGQYFTSGSSYTFTISDVVYDSLYEAIRNGRKSTLVFSSASTRDGFVYVDVLASCLTNEGLVVWGWSKDDVIGTSTSNFSIARYVFPNGSYH